MAEPVKIVWKRVSFLWLAILLAFLPGTPATSQGDSPLPDGLVSLTQAGVNANGPSAWPALSGDGTQIAFTSQGSDLVDQDTNSVADVFIRDRTSNRTRRISITSQGQQADAVSFQPSISANGRLIVFTTLATNLAGPYEVPDTNGLADVYLHDRDFATTQRISLAPGGAQVTGWSDQPSISANGRYVVYASTAPGLDSQDADSQADIFLYDHQEALTSLVSSPDGTGGLPGDAFFPIISADGRFIAYYYRSASQVSLFIYDQVSRHTLPVPVPSGSGSLLPPGWQISYPSLSPEARWLSWVSFNASQATLYQYDRQSGSTRRLQDMAFFSTSPGSPAITYSADSQQMILSLGGSIYRFDPRSGNGGKLPLLEHSTEYSSPAQAAISLDGRYLVFTAQTGRGQAIYSIDQGQAFLARTVLSGWVSDGLGNPLQDVVLSAGEELQTTSSEDGSYAFYDLPDGDYTVTPLLQGYTFSPPRWRTSLSPNVRSNLGLGFIALPQSVVDEARMDLGMPYSLARGCDSPFTPCGGPYHGFFSGDCTDLVIDAYLAGLKVNLQLALERDFYAHPRHYYRWRNARNAQDMWRYFAYSGLVLPPSDPYQPGDVVFFDWENDGNVDHVAIISEVNRSEAPVRILDAAGYIDDNPSGNATELEWKAYHQDHSPGHARWLIESPTPPDRADQKSDLFLVALDSPVVRLRLLDTLDRSISADALEIPGSSWWSSATGQHIAVADPIKQSVSFTIELKSDQQAAYQLGLQTIQANELTASTSVTGTLSAGETRLFPVQLQFQENTLNFIAPDLATP